MSVRPGLIITFSNPKSRRGWGWVKTWMLTLAPCPPIDSIITLMSVWRITGKIIRTTIKAIMLITYECVWWSSYNFRFSLFFCMFVFCVSVKVKLTVPLLCVCVHFVWKGRPKNDLYCVGRDDQCFWFLLKYRDFCQPWIALFSCLNIYCPVVYTIFWFV